MSMNLRERILSAFQLEEPDRVPVSILILNPNWSAINHLK